MVKARETEIGSVIRPGAGRRPGSDNRPADAVDAACRHDGHAVQGPGRSDHGRHAEFRPDNERHGRPYAGAAGTQLLRDLMREGVQIAACSRFVAELLCLIKT